MLEHYEICSAVNEQRPQEQVYEDLKIKYMRTPIFSFQSNEAGVLDHIAPNTFLSIL
jgi:hypothetical protein